MIQKITKRSGFASALRYDIGLQQIGFNDINRYAWIRHDDGSNHIHIVRIRNCLDSK